jgi:hypothetical protein
VDAPDLPTGITCFYPGNPSDSLGVDVSFNGFPQGPNGPQPGFWSRFSTGQIVAMVIAIAVVAICFMGMLVGIIADAGSPDESPTDAASTTEAPTEESPSSNEPSSPPETTAAPTTEEAVETQAADEGEGASEVYYENCDAARDAGAAPIHEGDPGYRAGLDRDGDGVGCEDSSRGGGSGGDSGGDAGGDSGGGDDDDDDGGSVYYENCDAARAAGAAPIHAGDPGYGSHLDRDGDGVACE